MPKRIAVVTFPNNQYTKEYYFLTDIEALFEGDFVAVDTVNGISVAEFRRFEVKEVHAKYPSKWIIQKINLTQHFQRLEAEKRANAIRQQLEEKRKEMEEIAIYKLLAQEDPEIAELVNELQTINQWRNQ